MSKPTRVGHCKATGKIMWLTEHDAATALGRMRKLRHRRGHMESRVYECDHCDRWHTTSWSEVAVA